MKKRRRGNCAICTARKRNGVGHTEEFCAYPGGPFDGRVSDAIAAARAAAKSKRQQIAKKYPALHEYPVQLLGPQPITQLAHIAQFPIVDAAYPSKDNPPEGLDANAVFIKAEENITEAVEETVRTVMLPPLKQTIEDTVRTVERATGSYQSQQIQLQKQQQQITQQQQQLEHLQRQIDQICSNFRQDQEDDNRYYDDRRLRR